MNILHIYHDCIMSKLDELIAATKQLAENPNNNDCASIVATGMICKTIIAAVGIIAATLLLWYLIKRVANGIKRYADSRRKRKDAEIERNYYEKHKAERKLMAEKERLFVLKKEYQTKALNYIEEQAKNHIIEQTEDGEVKYEKARFSCEGDTYLTRIEKYIADIDTRIEKLNANT